MHAHAHQLRHMMIYLHFQTEKWEHSTEDRPQYRISGQGGSGVQRVRIDEVGVDAHESCDHSNTNEECTKQWYGPLHLGETISTF